MTGQFSLSRPWRSKYQTSTQTDGLEFGAPTRSPKQPRETPLQPEEKQRRRWVLRRKEIRERAKQIGEE